jgi:hypothetical protein
LKRKKTIPLLGYYPIVIIGVLLFTVALALLLSHNAAPQNISPIKTINPGPSSSAPTTPAPAETDSVLFPYQSGGVWGYKNLRGEVAVAASFDEASSFFGEVAFAGQRSNGSIQYGLIDRQGRYSIQPAWDAWLPFNEQLAAIQKGNLWGYIDKSGQTVIPPAYEEAGPFCEGLALVKQGGRYGYIDKNGETAIPFSYLKGRDFSEGKAFVCLNGESCNIIIDQKGKVLFTLMGDGTHYKQGLAAVAVDNKVYYLNTDYKIAFDITPPSQGQSFSEGLAAVRSGDNWGYADQSGALIIQPSYEDALSFSSNLAAVKQNGKYGFIDKSGEIVLPFSYDAAQSFQSGYALVVQDGKAGLIDEYGNFTFLYNTLSSNDDA